MDFDEFADEKMGAIVELRTELEDGNITQEEYEELVEDLLDIEKIMNRLQNEEDKMYTQKVINKLKDVANVVKKIV